VLSITIILFETVKSIACAVLLLWHVHLKRMGVTTYQYLVEKE